MIAEVGDIFIYRFGEVEVTEITSVRVAYTYTSRNSISDTNSTTHEQFNAWLFRKIISLGLGQKNEL